MTGVLRIMRSSLARQSFGGFQTARVNMQPMRFQQVRWNTEKAEKESEQDTNKNAAEAETEEVDAEKDPNLVKIEQLQKDLAYALAEGDNARKIAKKDIEAARKFALQKFAKDLLEVSDNMDRAISSVNEEQRSESKEVQTLFKGIELTKHSLAKALQSHGVEAQEVQVGDAFDPNIHEALFNIPLAEGKEPNTIGNIIKVGYNYRERVLRASQVGVFNDA